MPSTSVRRNRLKDTKSSLKATRSRKFIEFKKHMCKEMVK